jgi:peptide subunit release factor 1 (eRF1)
MEHRKGEEVKKRFAHRTEEQKKDFLRKVSNKIEEEFKTYKLDYIFFGGNRLIRTPFLGKCKYCQRETQKIPRRTLNLGHAHKETLNHSPKEITSPLVFTF